MLYFLLIWPQKAGSFLKIGVCTPRFASEEANKSSIGLSAQAWGYGYGYKWHVSPMMPMNVLYGRSFRDGDIVTIVLDMDQRTLQYVHNDEDLGIAFTDLPEKLLPAVTLNYLEDQVTLLPE